MVVTVGTCLLVAFGSTAAETNKSDPMTLKEAFKNDFLVGAAINLDQIYGRDSKGVPIIETQFNSISPENVLKWEVVHPKPDKFDFAASDAYVNFGERNHMAIIGHTLIWHSQTPAWVFEDVNGKPLDRQSLLNRMSNHIFTVVGRYKGRIKGWDVVNEALAEDGTLRESNWKKIIGDDFVE
ncbi:MAG TPA: endo-1,4-beta-xylanase, partial [Candidatus Polarisedimenticolia bacterium]|nr:endo-1,4-beta-xylanase [Candidatus Polarisedimenticolia bacterium]